MTWKEFIHQVGREVRSTDFWPDTGNATQEQLDRTFVALVAAAARMPLHRLGNDLGTVDRTITFPAVKDLMIGPLPPDLFSRRDDKGIISLTIEGEVFSSAEAFPFQSVVSTAGNSYHDGNPRFAIDSSASSIYVAGLWQDPEGTLAPAATTEITTEIIPEPAKPALTAVNASTGAEVWKINPQDTEVIAQAIATHVTAVKNRDPQAAQIHQLLSKHYSGEISNG